jgi:major vault protein
MEETHPVDGKIYENAQLAVGQKVNIPGDKSFGMFPGQMVRIIQGHQLRSNQYLVARVYNEEAAKASLGTAILKPQTDEDADNPDAPQRDVDMWLDPEDVTTGNLINIKGTEFSFFIPPTGIEVVQENDDYVRQAVTLENLEYSVLLDEDGNKEYVYGPNVVFPRPTQKFLTKKGSDGKLTRKFRSIELNHLQGIYAKVIAPFSEDGRDYDIGEELFITGGDGGQRIFKPRAEIAIISYGDSVKHYAIAIPPGEARYSLNRDTGEISVVEGPTMWLPDPRKEVPIRRVLSSGQVDLLYPGNTEAQQYNAMLSEMMEGGSDFVTDRAFIENAARESGQRGITRGKKGLRKSAVAYASSNAHAMSLSDQHVDYEQASTEVVGEEFKRSAKYTKTPSITLDTKYEGVVTMDIWNNYAVLFVRKVGDQEVDGETVKGRRVMVGPQTVLLNYDENPEMLKLSKGKPKGSEPPVKTVYLRVKQNRVSDIIKVQTKDLVECEVRVVYQLDFEGDDPMKWFDVEDYVKFITDHCRSRLRNAAKKLGIEEFHADYIDIVRDTILGKSEDGAREGRAFEENACRIYEVDVLELEIGNAEIRELLVQAQRDTVKDTLELRKQRRLLEVVRETEQHARETASLEATTKMEKMALEAKESETRDTIRDDELKRSHERDQQEMQAKLAAEELQQTITEAALAYQKLEDDFAATQEQRKLDIHTAAVQVETASYVERANAVSADLVAAIQQGVAMGSMEKIAESLGVASYLEGESLYAVLHRMLAGTDLAKHIPVPPTNGGSKPKGFSAPSDLQQ